ncbi:RNA polymerase sigma-B factor [Actinacidiphila yanglinensis]|uniref:RNA polymerase sigma-B factor n=1 Tax=Actinacidiphila yanglinensis TaxID=310779 RepID=A0A1H6EFY2_9ACTN|nr:RNA polymerase sigma-B factor [Actinacidiphila yanglinensis]
MASNGYTAGSIDLPADDDGDLEGSRPYVDSLGAPDPEMDLVEDFQALAPLLDELGDRDRRLLQMRFGQEMTQSEIGAELGCSQMHVSRLLTRLLGNLRAGMLTDK